MPTPLAALLLAALPQASVTPAESLEHEPSRLVTVDLGSRPDVDVTDLQAAGLDLIYVRREQNEADVIAQAADLAVLDGLEVSYRVRHEDLEAYYRSRLVQDGRHASVKRGTTLTPPFGAGSMGGYWTFAEVESILDQLTAQYPAITTDKFSVGTTLEGRTIWAIKISDNPDVDEGEPEVRFDAMHHAREPQGMQTVLYFTTMLLEGYGTDPLATWLVDNRELWILPCVNPDGYVFNQTTNPGGGGLWRKNRRDNGDGTFGVDLNRNYTFGWGLDDLGSSPSTGSQTYRGPSAASEPETTAMEAFIASRSFATVLTVHTFSNLWLHPWGNVFGLPANGAQYTEISELATEVNGYVAGAASDVLYLANGTTQDHDHDNGSLCWTPEIGSSADGFWPPTDRILPLAQENELALRRTALAAGAFVHIQGVALQDAGDGDGFPEPGETVELVVTLRNSGLEAAGPVDVTLSSGSAFATVGTASHANAGLGSFSSDDSSSAPLTLTLAAGTPLGSTIDYSLTLSWDGLVEVVGGSLLVGESVELLADDVEVDLGWTAGLPGDTAATGLWEYGDPVGAADSGGTLSNPEDDATPGPGVNAFVTGNGSTVSGGDDVDNGSTTLVSPVLRLAGRIEPIITYQRWFFSDDDVLEVEITNDGSTWIPVEAAGQTGSQWEEGTVNVTAHVVATDQVQLRFTATDSPNNSITEAGIDELRLAAIDGGVPQLFVIGSGALGEPLRISHAADPGDSYISYYSAGTFNFTIPIVGGNPLLIDPATTGTLLQGAVPASGRADTTFNLPANPALAGQTVYFQSLVLTGSGFFFTERQDVLLN